MTRARLLKWCGLLSRDAYEIFVSGLFDVEYYRKCCGVRFSGMRSAIKHFLAAANPCDPHPLFSRQWYCETYTDVASAGIDPFLHFLRHGVHEGRSPSIYFDTRFYLDAYPDVAANRYNALGHYLNHGATEGRDPSPWFSTSDYLAAHGDVAAAGINALIHYALHGKAEGRKLSDRPFTLDHRYGMEEDRFALWRTQVVERHRRARGTSSLRDLIVVQSDALETCADQRARLQETAAAFGVNLASAHVCDLGRCIERAKPASLMLFVQSGDHLDDAGLEALLVDCPEEADLVVFDMFYRHDGSVFPMLQPGANPEHIRSADSVFSRFAIRGSLAQRIVGYEACDPCGLLLAALDRVEAETEFGGFHHVNVPVLETPSLDSAIEERRRHAILADDVASARPAREPRGGSVSVVICAKDHGVLLDQLLWHLTTGFPRMHEIFIVSSQTTDLVASRTLERWATHPIVTVLHYAEEFNVSDQSNLAANKASGELLLFLHDDLIGLDMMWLDRLIDAIANPGIGIVGPRLLYPNERVQHAGMYLGRHGTVGHIMNHAKLPDDDYLFTATSARDVSCVTAAALLVRRSTFDDLGGFDIQLRNAYQDVDLCLRVRGMGLRILYVPRATLLHLEAGSCHDRPLQEEMMKQGIDERTHLLRLYEDGRLRNDRFHNGAYDLNDESLRTLRS